MRLLDHGKQQHRIRLSGMDAPEKGQALGRRSKKSLSRLAFGKDARGDCHTRDRYDRNVCRAFVDKLDLSAARVELGMAWSFRTYANEQEAQARLLYEELEERARAVGTGL